MSHLITTQQALDSFCQSILEENPDFIAVDTEFMRERTYYPILCLIQVASPQHVAAIDPLAGLNLTPFLDLLRPPQIVKVFHAAYQDVEIFYYLMQDVPTPIFDTQIAAMACGYGDSVSYEALVNSLAKTSIDKGSRFTDWSRRPLTDRQLSYALGDVIHLRTVYLKLKEKLKERERESWITDEMEPLTLVETYDIDPSKAWQKIRYRNMKPKGLAYLREVAAIREQEAQKRDVPRPRILKDETLLEIAASTPRTKDQLANIRGITPNQATGPLGQAILQGIQKVAALPDSEHPQSHKPRPSSASGSSALIEMLKLLLKVICEENEVAPKLVASSRDIEIIARRDDPDTPALEGWRYDVFGKQALALKEGKIALAIKHGKIKFISI